MAEMYLIKKSEVIKPPVVEQSWNSMIVPETGPNAPVEPEINRTKLILDSVRMRKQGK